MITTRAPDGANNRFDQMFSKISLLYCECALRSELLSSGSLSGWFQITDRPDSDVNESILGCGLFWTERTIDGSDLMFVFLSK